MNAFTTAIQKTIQKDLDKLAVEINSFPSQASVWMIGGEIKNSAGNLCLHLCGNLQHFIGRILGNSSYVRDRDKEFSLKGLSQEALTLEIKNTKAAIKLGLDGLDPATLELNYPVKVFDEPMTTMHFLIHLTAHLEYHLGQINYHRRLLTAK